MWEGGGQNHEPQGEALPPLPCPRALCLSALHPAEGRARGESPVVTPVRGTPWVVMWPLLRSLVLAQQCQQHSDGPGMAFNSTLRALRAGS